MVVPTLIIISAVRKVERELVAGIISPRFAAEKVWDEIIVETKI